MLKTTIPFFSVVIATYKRAFLIQRALRSLISQTEADWEAIVVDDGSEDNTEAIVNSFIEKDKRIRYLGLAHKGMVRAKNAGIRLALGRYVTFLDSDDEYEFSHLEIRKRILIKNPSLKFLYGKVKIIGNPYVPNRFDMLKLIHLDLCVAGGNFVIESNTVRELRGFRNLKYGTDADLFDRAIRARIPIQEVLETTYIYHHETMDSNTNRLMLQMA